MRAAGIAALIAGIVLVALVVLGGDSGYQYRLLFQTGGQLVPGNEVLVGGQSIGTIDDIILTDDSEAEVKISVDQQLHEGTTAIGARDVALRDRQPLRLDLARAELRGRRSTRTG